MENIILYHGSTKVIEKPVLGLGNPKNDYGLGFYCTENLELAKEWDFHEILRKVKLLETKSISMIARARVKVGKRE